MQGKLLLRAPLLTLVVFVCVWWVCRVSSALLPHWTVSSSFHVSVPFHPLPPPVHFFKMSGTAHLHLKTVFKWEMAPKMTAFAQSWQATGQVSVCAQCNILSVWSLVVSVDIVMDWLLKSNFIYCFILFSKNAEGGGCNLTDAHLENSYLGRLFLS